MKCPDCESLNTRGEGTESRPYVCRECGWEQVDTEPDPEPEFDQDEYYGR